jgi:hypothetical protein
MTRNRLLEIGLLLALAACDSTGPSIANVTGAWTASWSIGGNGPSCTITTPMTLTQTGAGFVGTYGPGTMTCDGTVTTTTLGGSVTSGVVDGDSVSFDIDSPSLHQAGKFANSVEMSGTSAGSGGNYLFSGPWTAHR